MPPPHVRAATTTDAGVIAGWPSSAEEAARWCSRAEHPFPPEAITAWWEDTDVRPRVLVGESGDPVGYGELWVDTDEDEVELARLIVDPARRRAGLGRALVGHLVAEARETGLSGCFLRVVPDNEAALATYRSAGFTDVDPVTAAEWNAGQPTAYAWLQYADPDATTD